MMSVKRNDSPTKAVPPPLPPSGNEQTLRRYWVVGGLLGALLITLLIAVIVAPKQSEPDATPLGDGQRSASDSGVGDSASLAGSNVEGSSGPDTGVGPKGNRDDVEFNKGPSSSAANHITDKSTRSAKTSSASESRKPSVAQIQDSEPKRPAEEDKSQAAKHLFFTLEPDGSSATKKQPDEVNEPEVADVSKALTGRNPNGIKALLRANGGTGATEGAVKRGLEWLARNQREDGLWSLSGPYDDGSSQENLAAATAMALLAFQGAGHTHRGDPKEPFTRVVARGSAALIRHIEREGTSYRSNGQHGGYTQALCTIALCELYGMTRDAKLRRPASSAVEYCIDAQSPEGGWRYAPRQDSDTSVTGWFVMALQSARMADLKVPDTTWDRVTLYLNQAANSDASRYGYQPGVATTPGMTAEGLLCRQYLGWRRSDPRLLEGADYLVNLPPDWQQLNVYYWYYATQVCHHMQGQHWDRWNLVMRELLPAKQVDHGAERGSWEPHGDRYGRAGGRLYVTCMCLYMLEVYYRHLPIYQEAAIGR